MRRLILVILAATVLMGGRGDAQCRGQDLIAALPPAELAPLRAAADAVPFATGNAWHATRGAEDLYLVGTLHLEDPRHETTLDAVLPLLESSDLLLVEAGPQEERLLKARMARDPDLLINTTGPTLREVLTDAEWTALTAAMTARGVPGFMAAKLQPWYVSLLLSLPACAMTGGIPNGLDQRLMTMAAGAGIPVIGLEPYDTAFKMFDTVTQEAQIRMLIGALSSEAQSEDITATTINSYFAEDTRLSWEFLKVWTAHQPGYDAATAKAEYEIIEANLMNARNEAWIPVIEARVRAARGPVFVAFGALHLAGEKGVLNLLRQRGFALERIAFQ